MVASTATTKITVTVPEELAAYIRDRVAVGDTESVSAYVTRAAENVRDLDPLDVLIATLIAESGEPGDEAEAWIRDALAKARRAGRGKRPGGQAA